MRRRNDEGLGVEHERSRSDEVGGERRRARTTIAPWHGAGGSVRDEI